MDLTVNQCELLLSMFNASINHAMKSGIPIGREYYEDIDIIKDKLYDEIQKAITRENGGNEPWS
jgi:hypothetical protein